MKGESRFKYGPQYIHFQSDCLKEYTRRKHDISYEVFLFSEITVGATTLQELSNDYKFNLNKYELNIDVDHWIEIVIFAIWLFVHCLVC